MLGGGHDAITVSCRGCEGPWGGSFPRGPAWHVWVRKGLNAGDTAVNILLCQTRERQLQRSAQLALALELNRLGSKS